MDDKPKGSSTVVSFEQSMKAFSFIDITPEGIMIEPREEHPWKVSLPMHDMLPGRTMEESDAQPEKALVPRSVIFSGRVMETSLSQPLKTPLIL